MGSQDLSFQVNMLGLWGELDRADLLMVCYLLGSLQAVNVFMRVPYGQKHIRHCRNDSEKHGFSVHGHVEIPFIEQSKGMGWGHKTDAIKTGGKLYKYRPIFDKGDG